jgi:hypothetical protein
LQYKKRKGEKGNVLPDFFVGAHAAVSGYRLPIREHGRFSTYSPTVQLIKPDLTKENYFDQLTLIVSCRVF